MIFEALVFVAQYLCDPDVHYALLVLGNKELYTKMLSPRLWLPLLNKIPQSIRIDKWNKYPLHIQWAQYSFRQCRKIRAKWARIEDHKQLVTFLVGSNGVERVCWATKISKTKKYSRHVGSIAHRVKKRHLNNNDKFEWPKIYLRGHITAISYHMFSFVPRTLLKPTVISGKGNFYYLGRPYNIEKRMRELIP